MSDTRPLSPSLCPLESRLFLDGVFASFGDSSFFNSGFSFRNDSGLVISFNSNPGFVSNPASPGGMFPNPAFPNSTFPVTGAAGPIPNPIGSTLPFDNRTGALPFGSTGAVRPTASILSPDPGNTFRVGQTITFRGSAVSSNGSTLPSNSFVWRVTLHDRGRSRQVIQPVRGVTTGTFTVPRLGRLTANAFLRISLTVTDLTGVTDTVRLDLPRANPTNVGDEAPVATINSPGPSSTFSPGQRLTFDGFGFDTQDQFLPDASLTWRFALHAGGRSRGLVQPVVGQKSGTILVPADLPDLTADDFLRVALTVRDSDGNTGRTFVDLAPADPGNGGGGGTGTDGNGGNNNTAPTVELFTPSDTTTFAVGDTIDFSGRATDTEDGTLPADRFTWRVTLRDGQDAQRLRTIRGVRSGSFTVPDSLDPDPNQTLRLTLIARDSDGRASRQHVDLRPETSSLRFTSNFPDVNLRARLDGTTRRLPFETDTIVGAERTVTAPRTQRIDGVTYRFERWSDNGRRTHTVRAALQDRTLTAFYRVVSRAADGAADRAADPAASSASASPFSTTRIPAPGPLHPLASGPADDLEILR